MPIQITAAVAVVEVGSGRSAVSCFALVRSSACAFNPPHVLPRNGLSTQRNGRLQRLGLVGPRAKGRQA